MKIIKIQLQERSYPIFIGKNSSLKIGQICSDINIGRDAIIITNSYLKEKFLGEIIACLNKNKITSKLILVPQTEEAKSVKYCLKILNELAHFDKMKRLFIIAFGGGAIGDLAGFVASIYKRGIGYIQVPTTLLAQIDSAIGGKTAINLAVAKNLVGSFYQPKAVIVDNLFLKTLPKKQLLSGIAEAIKYAVIKDKKLFYFLKNNHQQIQKLDCSAIDFIQEHCIRIKAKIIQIDEREERGIRTILNFGHTIGHALESAFGYKKLTHGESISIGMACASEISAQLNLLPQKELKQILELINLYRLPTILKTPFKESLLNRIMNSLFKDKKFIQATPRFVLPVGIGKVIVKNNISEELIRETIKKHFQI